MNKCINDGMCLSSTHLKFMLIIIVLGSLTCVYSALEKRNRSLPQYFFFLFAFHFPSSIYTFPCSFKKITWNYSQHKLLLLLKHILLVSFFIIAAFKHHTANVKSLTWKWIHFYIFPSSTLTFQKPHKGTKYGGFETRVEINEILSEKFVM